MLCEQRLIRDGGLRPHIGRNAFAEHGCYEINGRRSIGKARTSVAALTRRFGRWRAVNITTIEVRGYVEQRVHDGYANGSINRELAGLKRMFRLAVQAGTLERAPYIPMLLKAPPRAGFFEAKQFEAVLSHLPPAIRPVALVGYELGWRLREILGLQWRQVDLTEGYLRLDPGTTKNREGRLAYLSPRLLAVLRPSWRRPENCSGGAARSSPGSFTGTGRGFSGSWDPGARRAGRLACPG